MRDAEGLADVVGDQRHHYRERLTVETVAPGQVELGAEAVTRRRCGSGVPAGVRGRASLLALITRRGRVISARRGGG